MQPRARAHSDAAAHRALSARPARPAMPRRVLARSRGAGGGSAQRDAAAHRFPTDPPPPLPNLLSLIGLHVRELRPGHRTPPQKRDSRRDASASAAPVRAQQQSAPTWGSRRGREVRRRRGRASTRSFGSEGTSAPPPKKLRWPATAARAAGTRAASSERVACLSIVEGSVGLHAKVLFSPLRFRSLSLRQLGEHLAPRFPAAFRRTVDRRPG